MAGSWGRMGPAQANPAEISTGGRRTAQHKRRMEGEEPKPQWQRWERGGIATPPPPLPVGPPHGTTGMGHRCRRAGSVPAPGAGRRPRRREVTAQCPWGTTLRREPSEEERRGKGFPRQVKGTGRGAVPPEPPEGPRCCPLPVPTALSAGKSDQSAKPAARTHTRVHA